MEILLPNGRLIVVEPGKAEIVGRALVDDPGNITIRLSGTGPIAQAADALPYTTTNVTVQLIVTANPAFIPIDLTNDPSGQVPHDLEQRESLPPYPVARSARSPSEALERT